MKTIARPQQYPVEVFWSDEDEGFIAVAPDLPGCSAWGVDQPEALRQLSDAIEAWIEAARAAGNPVPTPSRPADPERFSGKFLLRLPKSLHASLARRAQSEGVSLNQYTVLLLASSITTAEQKNYPVRTSLGVALAADTMRHYMSTYYRLVCSARTVSQHATDYRSCEGDLWSFRFRMNEPAGLTTLVAPCITEPLVRQRNHG
jgi:predicted RNase H-like HicB family nuclease